MNFNREKKHLRVEDDLADGKIDHGFKELFRRSFPAFQCLQFFLNSTKITDLLDLFYTYFKCKWKRIKKSVLSNYICLFVLMSKGEK